MEELNMRIAVCDDNIDELSHISCLLEDYRREHNNSITYETFHSATELLETIKSKNFDLFILDILMPGITGMEAAKEIRSSDSEIPIIFLTSSREFAVESYRVNAADYILKPARKDELIHVINKQFTKFMKEEAYFTLKMENGILKIPFSKIVYVEVTNRRIQFNLADGEIREAYGYLADYERLLLDQPCFYKPHRSYLVNLNYVTQLDKNGLITTIGKTVPVARDAYAKVKAAYMKHLLSANDRKDTI
jgi:DNA-binding LytR/AlgR family response regulator